MLLRWHEKPMQIMEQFAVFAIFIMHTNPLCLELFAPQLCMEGLSPSLALCEGNSSVTSEYPLQRPVTWCFDVFFDLRLNKRWVNSRDAGDLRRHRAHYDVTIKWGRIAHTYVSQLGHHCSGNGLAIVRRKAIAGFNVGLSFITFKKMHVKMWSARCRPFCPVLNMLNLDLNSIDLQFEWCEPMSMAL